MAAAPIEVGCSELGVSRRYRSGERRARLPHHEQLDAWMVAKNAIKEVAAEEGDEDEEAKKAPPKDPPPPKKASWRSIAAELVKAAPPEYASGAR